MVHLDMDISVKSCDNARMGAGIWLSLAAMLFVAVRLARMAAREQSRGRELAASSEAARESSRAVGSRRSPRSPGAQRSAVSTARMSELRAQAGVVVLRNNDWRSCTIDGLSADWIGRSGRRPRGFADVYPGRHQIITEVRGRPVILDFVLYPGEVLVRRLSEGGRRSDALGTPLPDRPQWLRDEREPEPIRSAAPPYGPGHGPGHGPGQAGDALADSLDYLDYLRTVQSSAALPDSEIVVPRVMAQFTGLLDRLQGGDDIEELLRDAYSLGLSLLRVPLDGEAWSHLVNFLDASAAKLAMHGALIGDYRLALAAVLMALAVLPGEAQLLDLKANLLSDGGLSSDALDVIDQALERVPLLDEKLTQRLRATKAEIVGRAGLLRAASPGSGRKSGGALPN